METLRRPHDMGGLDAGPVEQSEHDYAPWEKKVDAILRLLIGPERQIMTVDELRRGIEDLGPDGQDKMSYYERWISSVANILLEKGLIEVDELGRAMEDAKARHQAARADSA